MQPPHVGDFLTGAVRATLVVAAALVGACGDPTAPTRSATLCFSGAPLWVGIQNDGQGWRTMSQTSGPVGVRLTDRVVIGRVTAQGSSLATTLEFFYLSRSQAESTFVCGVGKELHGLITNIGRPDTATALIALGRQSTGTSGSYSLVAVPVGPQDLVSTHDSLAIIRRAQDYPDGSEVPVLDFASSEAFLLASNSITINAGGLPAMYWWSDLLTHRGTAATLVYSFQHCCGTRVYSVPAARLEDGDRHHIYAVAGV